MKMTLPVIAALSLAGLIVLAVYPFARCDSGVSRFLHAGQMVDICR